MKIAHIVHLPSKVSEIDFEDFYDERHGWQTKVEKLQARRWRAVKRYLKVP